MKTLAERFYDKVEIDHPSKCWRWTASTSQGYGTIWDGERVAKATRVSWLLWHGEAPPKHLEVMHQCDNPPCVNPYHLVLGTHRDNMHDCSVKGRRPLRNRLQIDLETALEIQRRNLAGESMYALAREYGISKSQVSNIRRGQRSDL